MNERAHSVEPETPRLEADAGYFQYAARTAFRDLKLVVGFEEARQIMAEIINSEAGARKQ